MKILFAVSNENISETIVKMYQKNFKEIISYKNVYYFNAILKELQRDKTYDRIVISEDLEPFANNNYDTIDKFLSEKLQNISEQALNQADRQIPIILIASDRRVKGENILLKLFNCGIYNVIIGEDRSANEVCKLINKPRDKSEAKQYYKISVDDANQAEIEDEVKEVEIQNILAHYKKLGKNEERYVDSFNNIAAQYTDAQLKVIIKFLPLNVKAVLEANSPKYQELTVGSVNMQQFNQRKQEVYIPRSDAKPKKEKPKKVKKEKPKKEDGFNFLGMNTKKTNFDQPVVIPSEVNTKQVKKINKNEEQPLENIIPQEEPIQQPQLIEEIEEPKMVVEQQKEIETIKEEPQVLRAEQPIRNVEKPITKFSLEQEDNKGRIATTQTVQRGEPQQPVKTIQQPVITQEPKTEVVRQPLVEEQTIEPQEPLVAEPVKRGRGRPKKVVQEQPVEQLAAQPVKRGRGRPRKVDVQPEIQQKSNDDILQTNTQSNSVNLFNLANDEEDEIVTAEKIPTIESPVEREEQPIQNYSNNYNSQEYDDEIYKPQPTNNTYSSVNFNIDSLLSKDKKIVTFVGTSKNGTSFVVNNLAILFSTMGIETAILDMTENRNSYYIFTKNDENLRKVASNSIDKLEQGIAEGLKPNKNLTVFTALPGEKKQFTNINNIMKTLAERYSLILIDCDFRTPIEYFNLAQEIYLVQSMDVLTIQPLTAFLRDLKAKNVLKEEKIRVIINKATKVKGLNNKIVIGGISYYNDPAMSFMTELFSRETVKWCELPFDIQVYSKYLEALVDCEVTINGYPKQFAQKLKELANMVYPLLNNQSYKLSNGYKTSKQQPTTFSNDMSNTLNQMKNRY